MTAAAVVTGIRARAAGLPPRFKLMLTCGISLLTGLLLELFSLLIAYQNVAEAVSAFRDTPLQLWATALFLALCVMFLALATSSLFAGGLLTALPLLAASYVDYFKLIITSTPLLPADLSLITKVGRIAGLNSASIVFGGACIAALLLTLLWLALLLWLSGPLRVAGLRARAAALCPLALFLCLFAVSDVADSWFYEPLDAAVTVEVSPSAARAACGVPLWLWRALLYEDTAAEPTDVEGDMLVEAILREQEAAHAQETDTELTPNVIMVLSESFFDITELPGVTYEADPLTAFHRAQKEGVSGRFYTRTLGYGTCNIELEVLTGINNRFLRGDISLCSQAPSFFEKLASVPQIFSDAGYYTAFLHTFNDSIYNRTPIYSRIGFDELFFSGDFAGIDRIAAKSANYWTYMNTKLAGGSYSDDYMASLLIMQERAKEEPVFLYAATMENHTPFPADKYDCYDYPFQADLSSEAAGALNALTQGCADSSAMLGRLMDYYAAGDEPTVIIFFGDHRPGLPLPDGGTLYSQLGMCAAQSSKWTLEETELMYSTDYVIWANDPLLLPDEPGSTLDTSSAFLGLMALEAAGMELTDFWHLVAAADRCCTAYNWHFFISEDGVVSSGLPVDADADLTDAFSALGYIHRKNFSD